MSDIQRIKTLFLASSASGLLMVILGLLDQYQSTDPLRGLFTGPFILLGGLLLPTIYVSQKIIGSTSAKVLYGVLTFFLTYLFFLLFGFTYTKLI